jgi:hypothetical protein
MINTILSSPYILAVLIPGVTYLVNRMLEWQRKLDAFKRLQDDPRVFVGALVSKLIDGNSGAVLITDCVLEEYGVGFVVLSNKKERVSFTCREFESLHPVYNFDPRR